LYRIVLDLCWVDRCDLPALLLLPCCQPLGSRVFLPLVQLVIGCPIPRLLEVTGHTGEVGMLDEDACRLRSSLKDHAKPLEECLKLRVHISLGGDDRLNFLYAQPGVICDGGSASTVSTLEREHLGSSPLDVPFLDGVNPCAIIGN